MIDPIFLKFMDMCIIFSRAAQNRQNIIFAIILLHFNCDAFQHIKVPISEIKSLHSLPHWYTNFKKQAIFKS